MLKEFGSYSAIKKVFFLSTNQLNLFECIEIFFTDHFKRVIETCMKCLLYLQLAVFFMDIGHLHVIEIYIVQSKDRRKVQR